VYKRQSQNKRNKVKLWKFEDGNFTALPSNNDQESAKLQNFQEKNIICSVALSPDGKQLATTAAKPPGRIKLWKTETGAKATEFQTQQGKIRSIVFNQKGTRLATVGGSVGKRTLRLWDTDGNSLALVRLAQIDRARFSPDGNLLVGIDDQNQLMVWDVSGDKLNPLYGQQPDQKFPVKTFEFNTKGDQLVTVGTDGRVSLWPIDDKQLLPQACQFVKGYLEHNPNVAESDRHLCDGVSPFTAGQPASVTSPTPVSEIPSSTPSAPKLECLEPERFPIPPEEQTGYYTFDGLKYAYDGSLKETTPPDGKQRTQVFLYGRYDGAFKDGKRNGCGMFTFNNEQSYLGNFSNDNYDGVGKYTWENGDYYQGFFKNGKCNGLGIFYKAEDGTFETGKWKEDKESPVREGFECNLDNLGNQ
jgi:hypothetical protein